MGQRQEKQSSIVSCDCPGCPSAAALPLWKGGPSQEVAVVKNVLPTASVEFGSQSIVTANECWFPFRVEACHLRDRFILVFVFLNHCQEVLSTCFSSLPCILAMWF